MIADEDLERLVDRFYAKVRRDELIGPLFNSAVHDWPEHLVKLGAFWSSVMNCSGRYKGNPMAAHLRHVALIEPRMFERWIALWKDTAREELAADQAEAVIAKAERISESLQLGLFFKPEARGAAA
jgi:hemoglobin